MISDLMYKLIMRKSFMAASAITLMMMTAVLTSCKDDEVTPEPATTGVAVTENPTEDALAVKYDGNYVVYGELNDGIAAALQRLSQGGRPREDMIRIINQKY